MELQRRKVGTIYDGCSRNARRKFVFEYWMDVNIDFLRKSERMFYDYVPTKSNLEKIKDIKFLWLEKKRKGVGFEKWLENVEKNKYQVSSTGKVRTFTEWREGRLQELVKPKELTQYTYKDPIYNTNNRYLYVFMHFQEVNVFDLMAVHFSSYTIVRDHSHWGLDSVIFTPKNGNYRDIGIKNINYVRLTNKHSFVDDYP